MIPPTPDNEADRLDALLRMEILDSPPEESFDRISRLVQSVFDAPIVFISMIDRERQWFKSTIGLDVPESPRELAFCSYTILNSSPMVVPDATQDSRFRENPFVVGEMHLRFYAGVPLQTRDGYNIGTLCAMDTKPRDIDPKEISALEDLAQIVVDELELRDASKRTIYEERKARDITEQRFAEKNTELSEVSDRYERLLEIAPIGAMIVIDGKVVFANHMAAEMLSYENSDALIGIQTTNIVHPDFHNIVQSRFRTVVTEKISPEPMEQVFVTVSGEEIPVETTATPVLFKGRNGLLSVFKDISSFKNAINALRASQNQLQAVVDNADAAIFLKDHDGNYLLVNRLFCEWYGVSAEEVIGRTFADVFPALVSDGFETKDEDVMRTGRRLSWETELQVPDATTKQILMTKIPVLNSRQESIGLCGFATDISSLKKTQDRLQQVQKMEAMGQLTGGIAHDFNNLLGVIQGNAELLSQTVGSESSMLNAILRAAARGSDLTQRLLAYSRRQPLRPQTIDIGKLVNELEDILSRTLGETTEIELDMEPELWQASADPSQVESAILNLAINARDAMPDGGKLTISGANRSYAFERSNRQNDMPMGDYVVLSVTDTGTGMSEEVLERAFEPFYTTKDVGQGSGLGLSMVYGFARQSGGQLTIDSVEGFGTTVSLILPRAITDIEVPKPVYIGTIPMGQNERILVIEDDRDVRNLVVIMLKTLKYQVIEALDARQAERILHQRDVDLVLSDVVLPGGVSGPEFIDKVKRERPSVKTILMSGYSPEAAKQSAVLSTQQLLTKPFTRMQLATAMREVLGNPDN